MNRKLLRIVFAATVLSASILPGTAALAQGAASSFNRDVIVILRDQRPDLPAVRGARQARATALAIAQVPIVTHLQASGATRIRGFVLINAVAANVSAAEEELLAAHPLVQAVVPVVAVKLPHFRETSSPQSKNGNAPRRAAGRIRHCATPSSPRRCNSPTLPLTIPPSRKRSGSATAMENS